MQVQVFNGAPPAVLFRVKVEDPTERSRGRENGDGLWWHRWVAREACG